MNSPLSQDFNSSLQKPLIKNRKFSTNTLISNQLFNQTVQGASSAPTALEDSYSHYYENHLLTKIPIAEVNYTVPYPAKCQECEYEGFTEVKLRDTACSKVLQAPIYMTFGVCWLFGTCLDTKQTHCFDEYKEIDHQCYNCKALISLKKSVIEKRSNKGIKKNNYLQNDTKNEGKQIFQQNYFINDQDKYPEQLFESQESEDQYKSD
ncbi:UNKNOWN [Stylonychia lemnae]|uniref:LITAF domain-containing protein n=1 Tax=Stylonychia lemnae TaxID=5949 RepID=A0A078A1X3_STYLE|nr:UNKNOWN [Stylonychia lemnae]|eukprot:CDW74789.1 UNKNOWN [Stylonychia lemnae]